MDTSKKGNGTTIPGIGDSSTSTTSGGTNVGPAPAPVSPIGPTAAAMPATPRHMHVVPDADETQAVAVPPLEWRGDRPTFGLIHFAFLGALVAMAVLAIAAGHQIKSLEATVVSETTRANTAETKIVETSTKLAETEAAKKELGNMLIEARNDLEKAKAALKATEQVDKTSPEDNKAELVRELDTILENGTVFRRGYRHAERGEETDNVDELKTVQSALYMVLGEHEGDIVDGLHGAGTTALITSFQNEVGGLPKWEKGDAGRATLRVLRVALVDGLDAARNLASVMEVDYQARHHAEIDSNTFVAFEHAAMDKIERLQSAAFSISATPASAKRSARLSAWTKDVRDLHASLMAHLKPLLGMKTNTERTEAVRTDIIIGVIERELFPMFGAEAVQGRNSLAAAR